jgi:hypothetical protein
MEYFMNQYKICIFYNLFMGVDPCKRRFLCCGISFVEVDHGGLVDQFREWVWKREARSARVFVWMHVWDGKDGWVEEGGKASLVCVRVFPRGMHVYVE